MPFDLEQDARDYRVDEDYLRLLLSRVITCPTDKSIEPVVLPQPKETECPE